MSCIEKVTVSLSEDFGYIARSVAKETLEKMIPLFIRSISEKEDVREFPLSTLAQRFNQQRTVQSEKRFLFLLFLECAISKLERCVSAFLKNEWFQREMREYMEGSIQYAVQSIYTGRLSYVYYEDILSFLYERIQPRKIEDAAILQKIMESMDDLPPSFLESYGMIHIVKSLQEKWEKERAPFFLTKEPVY